MWRDPYQRQGWGEWLLGWLFTLLLLAFAAEALAQMVRPMLPWIGLVVIVLLSAWMWVRSRERW